MHPLRKVIGNFFAAKAIGAIIMVILMPAVFYSYTAFTKEILAVDIATFMVAVLIGPSTGRLVFIFLCPTVVVREL